MSETPIDLTVDQAIELRTKLDEMIVAATTKDEQKKPPSPRLGAKFIGGAIVTDAKKKTAARPIFAKLVAVMGDLKRIPKRGWNDFHKYAYTTDEDVMDALRPVFVKHGVAFFPTLVEETTAERAGKNKATYHTRIKLKVRFIDPETGDEESGEWIGTANDDGDKGIYKAYTGCLKYALTATTMLSSGDDPEKEKEDPGEQKEAKPETPEQRLQTMVQAFGSVGVTRRMIEAKYNVTLEQLTPDQLEELRLAFANIARNPKAKEQIFGKPQSAADRIKASIAEEQTK